MENGLDNTSATVIRGTTKITLTEQKLCRIWLSAACGGDWWDMYQQLRAIRDVLKTVGQDAAADMFDEAAHVALARCVYDLQSKEAA